jgi:hypothetical protein
MYSESLFARPIREQAIDLASLAVTVIGPAFVLCLNGSYRFLIIKSLTDALGIAWGWILFRLRTKKTAGTVSIRF